MPKLWKPTALGNEMASRRLVFEARRRRRKVVVKIGQPVRQPRPASRDPWWCPFEIVGLGKPELAAAAGEDSVQALVLALRAIEVSLLSRAKRGGGVIEWLGELERPVFAHTFFLEAYQAAIASLVEGLKLAQELVEHPSGSIRFEEKTELLRQLTESRGFRKRATRQRATSKRAG